MSSAVFNLEREIRERTAFLTEVPAENLEARQQLMAALDRVRGDIPRQDALWLEVLIERRTGGRP